MNTKFLTFVMALTLGTTFANEGKYQETMTKNIELIYKAQTAGEIQQAINVFERVGTAEKSRWEPFYYSAFGYVMLANKEQDPGRKDAYLDQAKSEIEKASALQPDNSEIVAMEGFIHMIRVTVDPATRGPQFSMLAMHSFNKAISLNEENPRALALIAQLQFGTAKFFNASTAEACATSAKALEKFNGFKSDNPLAPRWGKGMAEEMVKNCQ